MTNITLKQAIEIVDKQTLTTRELSVVLGCSKRTILNMIKDGRIPKPLVVRGNVLHDVSILKTINRPKEKKLTAKAIEAIKLDLREIAES